MNDTLGPEAGQHVENQSGINTNCAECVKLAEKLEKCKGSAENKTNGEASDKSPKTRKEECKHLRMRIRKSSWCRAAKNPFIQLLKTPGWMIGSRSVVIEWWLWSDTAKPSWECSTSAGFIVSSAHRWGSYRMYQTQTFNNECRR